jgi:hypothetical protein
VQPSGQPAPPKRGQWLRPHKAVVASPVLAARGGLRRLLRARGRRNSRRPAAWEIAGPELMTTEAADQRSRLDRFGAAGTGFVSFGPNARSAFGGFTMTTAPLDEPPERQDRE